MDTTAKILVLGPPEGPQGQFVSAVSEVKVRSSTRTTASGEGTVPMDFGRVRLGIDLDLQLFGFDRDRAGIVADAVAPGVLGAVILVSREDVEDPHFASTALDELSVRAIPSIVAIDDHLTEPAKVSEALRLSPGAPVATYATLDKETVKTILVQVLEAAMLISEGSAA